LRKNYKIKLNIRCSVEHWKPKNERLKHILLPLVCFFLRNSYKSPTKIEDIANNFKQHYKITLQYIKNVAAKKRTELDRFHLLLTTYLNLQNIDKSGFTILIIFVKLIVVFFAVPCNAHLTLH